MYKKNSHEIIDFHLHSVKSGGSLARNARFCASNSQAGRSRFFLRGRRATLGACQYLRVVFSWQAQRFVLVDFAILWQAQHYVTWCNGWFNESQCQGCTNMTQCQKSWQGQHSVTCLNCGGSVAKVFLWCFGCVFVVVFLCFCDGVVVFVVVWLCFCGRVFVFLWLRFCVFVMVWLCFCGGVVVFLWWCGCVFVVVSCCLCGCVFVFCGGVVVFLWLCFCGGAVVFLWWCCAVFVVVRVFLWWCGCVFVVVFFCFCGCVFVFL